MSAAAPVAAWLQRAESVGHSRKLHRRACTLYIYSSLAMGRSAGRARRLADYRPPAYTVRDARLVFVLGDAETVVEMTAVICATADQAAPPPLVLDGERRRQPALQCLRLRLRSLAPQHPMPVLCRT